MAHVFIVDEKTLNVHLKYMFAGTGAKDFKCDFLLNNAIEIKPSTERLLSGMISDISRVKPGDDIIFYLQQTALHEGMFFGSFKVIEAPFLANDNYLEEELDKNLTFRVKLKADKVYPKGITERECLDSLKGINHPSELCWSLIYRKLKGNRGCTMITDYEYKSIIKKISDKNFGYTLDSVGYAYSKENNEIIPAEKEFDYSGKKESLDITERLKYKRNKKNAYETHLQAYILQNIEKIDVIKPVDGLITWLGNEVSCGVGMQSIDICFQQDKEDALYITICELKDEQPVEYIRNQIFKYVSWIKDYIVPTYSKKIIVIPTIIAPEPTEKTKIMYSNIKNSIVENECEIVINPIRYISFSVGTEIEFKEVE